jgi:arylsulfatase A-like enzyme
MWGFDTVFDTFRYTQTPEPFVDGMDTYTYLRNEVGERSALQVMGSITKRCLTHEHPLQSIANLGNVGINAVSRRYLPFLTRLPHQTFAPNPQHTYLPEKNTKLLTEIIEKRSTADQPFFAFVNYMDTHRPYQAPADLQRKHLGRELSKSEFERLNDKVGAPWGFVRLVQNDDVRDEDVETLRRLYAASVESVDRHIRRLLASLESADIREETIVIIVGDHGENLGETDEQGRTRFGHEASISDYVARVPMIVSTPATESQVDEIASIKDVYGYLLKASDPECSTADLSPQDLVSERAFCEYPALPDKTFYEKYPDIDRRYLSQRVETDSVAAYGDEWRIVIESDGTELAFRSQQQEDIEKAPADLVAAARETCETLSSMWSVDEITSQQTRDRLEELGYL